MKSGVDFYVSTRNNFFPRERERDYIYYVKEDVIHKMLLRLMLIIHTTDSKRITVKVVKN